MIFSETKIPGAFIIDLERLEDGRGFFARSWCQYEFATHGLNSQLEQCNTSYNAKHGTLRGMHYQDAPHEEAKLIRCTRGRLYDVVLDLRPASSTYRQWVATELTAENHRMVYLPEGCAHGFLTLEDHTEAIYLVSKAYAPEYYRGVRWSDPAFGIIWPVSEPMMSERDRSYPLVGTV